MAKKPSAITFPKRTTNPTGKPTPTELRKNLEAALKIMHSKPTKDGK